MTYVERFLDVMEEFCKVKLQSFHHENLEKSIDRSFGHRCGDYHYRTGLTFLTYILGAFTLITMETLMTSPEKKPSLSPQAMEP